MSVACTSFRFYPQSKLLRNCQKLLKSNGLYSIRYKTSTVEIDSSGTRINFNISKRSSGSKDVETFDEFDKYLRKEVIDCELKNGQGQLSVAVNVLDGTPETREKNGLQNVLLLHGLVGSYRDFKGVTERLMDQGLRCIIPEMPGFGDSELSRDDIYNLNFTSEGQYQMLQSVLEKLKVERIDCVVAHSAGSWLACKFGAEWQNVRSMALINPMSICPNKAMRPYWWTKLVAAISRERNLRYLADFYVHIGARRSGFKTSGHKKRQLFVSLETVSTVRFDLVRALGEHQEYLAKIRERQIPLFVAWSRNDKMIEESLSTLLCQRLGITDRKDTHRTGCERVAAVFNDGHVLHKTQSEAISTCIIKMIKEIKQ